MRRKILITIAAVVAGVLLFGAGTVLGASSHEPGSQGDPLVTLSYLNSRIEALKGEISGGNSGSAITGTAGSSSGTAAASGFTQISLTKGQQLTLSDGAEAVVYSGNGTVKGTTGMLNLSTGELFSSGTTAVLYAHFMGLGGTAGISAQSAMTVYVRGGYTVE